MADAKIVISAVDKTRDATDSARLNLDGLTSSARAAAASLLGFGAAVGAALAGWAAIVGNSRAIDQFNDLRDTTGASIENISALDRIARETGGTFEGMSTSLIKFNGVLNKVGDDSQQAGLVFKELGLNADELKKMDPAEALLKTAQAFQNFEVNGNSARAMQALFGKSVKDVAPFLKDLAEKGELVAKTSTKAAEQAEEFNKALYRMQANSTDTARKLIEGLLPALTSVLKGFQGIPEKINLLGLANDVVDADKALKSLQGRQGGIFNFAGNLEAEITKAKDRLEAAKSAFKAADKKPGEAAPTGPKPSLPDTKPPKAAGATENFAQNFINQLITEYANLTGAMSKTDEVTRKLATSTDKFTVSQRNQALALAGQIDAQKVKAIVLQRENEELAANSAAREASEDAYGKSIQGLIKGNQAQAFELSLIGKTTEQVERLRFERELALKVLEAESRVLDDRNNGLLSEIEARQKLQAIARLAGETKDGYNDIVKQTEARLRDPLAGYNDAFIEYEKMVGRVAISTKNMMTSAFTGMEDALVNFVKTGKLDFSSLANSIITDLIRIQVQQSITKPLSQAVTSAGGASGIFGGIKDFFGFADGGIMSGGGPMPLHKYASGGIASTPQLALFGEGRMNEAFVPLPDGRSIPVTMQGGGGNPIVVNQSFAINATNASAETVGQIRALMPALLAENRRAVEGIVQQSANRRGGRM